MLVALSPLIFYSFTLDLMSKSDKQVFFEKKNFPAHNEISYPGHLNIARDVFCRQKQNVRLKQKKTSDEEKPYFLRFEIQTHEKKSELNPTVQ